MATMTIAAEGAGAREAVTEFLALPGLRGEMQRRDGVVYRDGGALAVVATILGIAGGVAQLVSSIIEWREKWIARGERERLSVVLQDAHGNRLALADATPEQITAALKTLAAADAPPVPPVTRSAR